MNIYIGKENLPKDAKFLFDVEQFFPQVLIADCEFNREVIRVIDGGEYVSTTMFKDRFGGGLRKSCLSTSCKTLITLYQCPDIIVNCAEIGVNALDYVVKCPNANAYFPNSDFDIQTKLTCTVFVNGKECKDLLTLNNTIMECGV